jgi:hypothetical protein
VRKNILKFQKELAAPPQGQDLRNNIPHIFVGIAGSWDWSKLHERFLVIKKCSKILDWSHYENLQMVFLTKSNFYVKNFSFLIIFLSKSLYKGHKFNEKYRKIFHFGGPTPRLILGLTGIASKNPAILNEY